MWRLKQYIYNEGIDLPSDSPMVIQGPEKTVVGNNHTITFEIYRTFTANTYLTVSELNVQCGDGGSVTSVYWSLEQGCEFDNVEGRDLHLAANACRYVITDCVLEA